MSNDTAPRFKLPQRFVVVQPQTGTIAAVIGARRERDLLNSYQGKNQKPAKTASNPKGA